MPRLSVVATSDLAREIAARVRRARDAAGISQSQLAAALGISQAAVSNLEAGTRPLRVEELVVLSRLLGKELDYFVAPTRSPRGPVGVTLRASVAELALPDFREAVNAFLDDVEAEPLPEPTTTIGATNPEEAAAQVRQATGQKQPPIDVREIAHKLGVGVFTRPFPEALSALILRHGENAIIGVNSGQSHVRQRFSIAHELGHFVLHHHDQHFIEYGLAPSADGEQPNYHPVNERAANQFAAELLMPAELVRKDAKTSSLARLATRYEVSQEAMGFRLVNLGL